MKVSVDCRKSGVGSIYYSTNTNLSRESTTTGKVIDESMKDGRKVWFPPGWSSRKVNAEG